MQTQQVTFRIKFERISNEKIYIEIINSESNTSQEFEMIPESINHGMCTCKMPIKIDSSKDYQYRYIKKTQDQIEMEEILRKFKYCQKSEHVIDEWNKIWCFYQIGKIEKSQTEIEMKNKQSKNDLVFDCQAFLNSQQIKFWQEFVCFIKELIKIQKFESVEMNQDILKVSFNWRDFQLLVNYQKIQINEEFISKQLVSQKQNLFYEQKFQELWKSSFRMIKHFTEQVFAFKIEKEEEKLKLIIQQLYSKINEYSEVVVKFLVDEENQKMSHSLKQILSRYYFILHSLDGLQYESEMAIDKSSGKYYQIYAEKVLKQLNQCYQNLQLVQGQFQRIRDDRAQSQQDQQISIEKVEKMQDSISHEHELVIFNLEKNLVEAKKVHSQFLDTLNDYDRRQKEQQKEIEISAKMNQERLRFLENLDREIKNQQLEKQKKELEEYQKYASEQILQNIKNIEEISNLKQQLENQKINEELKHALSKVDFFEKFEIDAAILELKNLDAPLGLINSLQKYADIISGLKDQIKKLINDKEKYQQINAKLKLQEIKNQQEIVSQHLAQLEELQKDAMKKIGEAEKYQQIVAKLKISEKQLQTAYNELKGKLDQSEKRIKDIEEEKNKKIEKIEELLQRNKKLLQLTQDQKQQLVQMEQNLLEQQRKEKLQEQEHQRRMNQMQNQLDEAKENEAILKRELSQIADLSIDFLKGEQVPSQFQSEFKEYSNILVDLKKILNCEKIDVQNLQNLLGSMNDKISSLQQKIKISKQESSDIEKKYIEKLEHMLNKHKNKINNLEIECKKYKESDEQLKDKCKQYQDEEKKYQEKIQSQQQQIEKEKQLQIVKEKQQSQTAKEYLMDMFEQKAKMAKELINIIQQSQEEIKNFQLIITRHYQIIILIQEDYREG